MTHGPQSLTGMYALCSCYVDRLAFGLILPYGIYLSRHLYVFMKSLNNEMLVSTEPSVRFGFMVIKSVSWPVLCFVSNFEKPVSVGKSMNVWEFWSTQTGYLGLQMCSINTFMDMLLWHCFLTRLSFDLSAVNIQVKKYSLTMMHSFHGTYSTWKEPFTVAYSSLSVNFFDFDSSCGIMGKFPLVEDFCISADTIVLCFIHLLFCE